MSDTPNEEQDDLDEFNELVGTDVRRQKSLIERIREACEAIDNAKWTIYSKQEGTGEWVEIDSADSSEEP
jgi:hypothetical protein